MFPAEHRALRELHATTRQLAGHWAKLGDRLGGEEGALLDEGATAARVLLDELEERVGRARRPARGPVRRRAPGRRARRQRPAAGAQPGLPQRAARPPARDDAARLHGRSSRARGRLWSSPHGRTAGRSGCAPSRTAPAPPPSRSGATPRPRSHPRMRARWDVQEPASVSHSAQSAKQSTIRRSVGWPDAARPERVRSMSVDVVVAVPAFMDMTFVGLEGLPGLGEERFAGDLVRSPGGGAITAIGCARLGPGDRAGRAARPRRRRRPDRPDARGRGRPARRPAFVADAGDRRDADRRRARDGHLRPRRPRPRDRRRRAVAARRHHGPEPARRRAAEHARLRDRGRRRRARVRRPPAGRRLARDRAVHRAARGARADRRRHAAGGGRDDRRAREDRRRLAGRRRRRGVRRRPRGRRRRLRRRPLDRHHRRRRPVRRRLGLGRRRPASRSTTPCAGRRLYAALSVRVPTGAGGATRLAEFVEEGTRRGLPTPPPRGERVA